MFSYDGSGFSDLVESNFGHSGTSGSMPRFQSKPLIAGGIDDNINNHFKSENMIDMTTGSWETIPDYPIPGSRYVY